MSKTLRTGARLLLYVIWRQVGVAGHVLPSLEVCMVQAGALV